MSSPHRHPPLIAGGDIRPCRFIKQSTAADNTALEADANERTIGISGESTAQAPYGTVTLHASTEYPTVEYNTIGEEALLELGSGGATRGDLLTPDADGKGVSNTTDKRWYGARALESGLEGEKIRVLIDHGYNAV